MLFKPEKFSKKIIDSFSQTSTHENSVVTLFRPERNLSLKILKILPVHLVLTPETIFLNFSGAQESILRKQFR